MLRARLYWNSTYCFFLISIFCSYFSPDDIQTCFIDHFRCAVYYWILLKKIKFRNSSIGIAGMFAHTNISFMKCKSSQSRISYQRFCCQKWFEKMLENSCVAFSIWCFWNKWSNSHKYVSGYVYRSSWHTNIADEINHQYPQELTVEYKQCQP